MPEMDILKAAFEAANDLISAKSDDFTHAVTVAYMVGKEQGKKEAVA